jgi:sugar/nucleoside kinase (ribokinase family)
VAVGLARLGSVVRLCARVGLDPAAEVSLREARDAGVDLAFVQYDAMRATGLCFAAVSPGGERTFFSYRGANVGLEKPAEGIFANVGLVHVAAHALLEGPQLETTLGLLEEAARRGIPASLDLCLPLLRRAPALVRELAPRFATIFANELELETITKSAGPAQDDPVEAALVSLLGWGAPLVVGKLGARGSVAATASDRDYVPAFPIEARDTTGAGDGFVAAFLHARRDGASPSEAARLGNAAGALVALKIGAASAMPTQRELIHFSKAFGYPKETKS